MSTYCPPVSKRPSISRRLRPLSMTCVRPSARGFPGRGGRSRNPSKLGIELLQLLSGPLLHVVEERVAVAVDSDDERPEVLDAELPEALGHEILPGDLLDLLDLGRLERRRAADDREVDHSEALHRLDRLVRQTALAADRTDAVFLAQALGKADHASARRRSDAELFVFAGAQFPHVRSGVQEEGSLEVHRRLHALVEDPDLRAIADADDVAVDEHLVAGTELADLFFGGRKRQPMAQVRPLCRSARLRSRRHALSLAGRPSTGS